MRLKDSSTDFLYWMSRSEVERLEAIETLRQQYINYKKDVQPRLQRVYKKESGRPRDIDDIDHLK